MSFRREHFHDNEGYPIRNEEDIVVTNLSDLEKGVYHEINNSLYGTGEQYSRIFSAYIDRKTKVQYDIICSKRTKEIIPFDCLNKPTYTILLCGIQGVGKTTTLIQYIIKCPDIISSGGDVSVRSALDLQKLPDEIKVHSLNYLRNIKPAPSLRTMKNGCESVLFYVDSDEEAAVKMLDVPGEVHLSGASAFFDHCDAVFLFLDLSDPVTEQGRILEQLQKDRITELKNAKRISNSIPIYVILTKADKLEYKRMGSRKNLSREISYSTELNEYDRMQLKADYHATNGGYNYDLYRDTETKIRAYMRGVHPGIYKALVKAFGNNLRFFITGNYMKEVYGAIPDDISMYRVEQPFLHFMVENNLYPSKNLYTPSEDPEPGRRIFEAITGVLSGAVAKVIE